MISVAYTSSLSTVTLVADFNTFKWCNRESGVKRAASSPVWITIWFIPPEPLPKVSSTYASSLSNLPPSSTHNFSILSSITTDLSPIVNDASNKRPMNKTFPACSWIIFPSWYSSSWSRLLIHSAALLPVARPWKSKYFCYKYLWDNPKLWVKEVKWRAVKSFARMILSELTL